MDDRKDRFRQIRKLFDGASALQSPEQRDAWLAEMAGNDLPLRQEVERLLAASEMDGGFFDRQAAGATVALEPRTPERWEGRRIGPYEILSELGQGGMGVVYLARRADGAFEKQVAIKIVRQSLATQEFLVRFQRERDILARLEHPHIARLLDGGTSAGGQAYLVMEFVKGEPLLAYADSRRLPYDNRLELLRQVAEAVDYAHEQGVVHRDLKPSNIFVSADGQVKLLDFGIAAWQQGTQLLNANVRETLAPTIALSPAYASPEQARGERTTKATDIYSFAVVAYELLAGVLPFAVQDLRLEDLLAAVSEKQPTPASAAARASKDPQPYDLGFRRRIAPSALMDRLEHTADLPLSQALSKRPSDRPASASDLVRTLMGVAAPAPKTVLDRILGASQRHAALLSGGVLLLVLVLTGQIELKPFGWITVVFATIAGVLHGEGLLSRLFEQFIPWQVVLLVAGPIALDRTMEKAGLGWAALVAVPVLILPLGSLIHAYVRRGHFLGERLFQARSIVPASFRLAAALLTAVILFGVFQRANWYSPGNLSNLLVLIFLGAFYILPFEVRDRGAVLKGAVIRWSQVEHYCWLTGTELEFSLRTPASSGSRRLRLEVNPDHSEVIDRLLRNAIIESPRLDGHRVLGSMD